MTSAPEPDVLTLEASDSVEVVATHIDVRLTVVSASSIRSQEASRALAEIRELTEGLRALGIDEGQMVIQGAEVAEGKGLFGRGSTARFRVVLRKIPADTLVGVLETATRLAHTEHEQTVWRFDVTDETQAQVIREASARARRRAETAAAALGAKIVGVKTSTVHVGDGQAVRDAPLGAAPAMMSKSRVVSSVHSATGIDLVKTMELQATVSVTFRLA